MILLWLILWFWYDFDMVDFSCSDFVTGTLCFQSPPPQQYQRPHLRSRVALCFFSWPFVSACVGPPPPRVRRSTGNPQQRTNTEPGSPRSSRILNPGIWTAVILSHKHRKIKSYSSYLCIFHSRLTRIIPVRPCRLFLGSLGTSLWEAWEGEKGAGQLTRMSLILTLGLTCPFSEQNGAKWYWKLTSEWLTASD